MPTVATSRLGVAIRSRAQAGTPMLPLARESIWSGNLHAGRVCYATVRRDVHTVVLRSPPRLRCSPTPKFCNIERFCGLSALVIVKLLSAAHPELGTNRLPLVSAQADVTAAQRGSRAKLQVCGNV
jgi:hypothetical protein